MTGTGRADRLFWSASAVLFLVGLGVFLRLAFGATTDIELHAAFIADCIRSRFFPVDFLYYFGVAVLALFSTRMETLLAVSAVVLAGALTAKFQASLLCILRWIELPEGAPRGFYRGLLFAALGLAFIFCLPLPGQNWYLGQFPPNQWHNSTNIVVIPLAVLLFYYSTEFLKSGSARLLFPVGLFTILNLLTKPSLFLPFAVVFPLYALLRFGPRRRAFWQALLPVAAGSILLVLYYLFVFHHPEYRELMESQGVGLEFGWFEPWRQYSGNIPLSVVNSLLLPLLALALYPGLFRESIGVRYSLGLLVVGLLIFSFVHETGDRALHGNLSWQNITSNYLLHLALLAAWAGLRFRGATRPFRDRLLIAAFAVEVLVGLAYIVTVLRTGNYI